VDLVLPVHGAAELLAACLASLDRSPPFGGLLLVADGPQPSEVERLLAIAAGGPLAARLVRSAGVGFAAAVNAGLAETTGDVVLLNSDTEVTTGWLGKLQRAALSRRDVATVTPFSNHATICSLPRPLAHNTLPAGYDLEGFAALVERASVREYPKLPTAVGFCMYVRRQAVEAVGPFDEGHFGPGYGEENDFCLRATDAGLVHLLDDATYVWHAGEGSFGRSGEALRRRAMRALRLRHPTYLRRLAAFLGEDPLRPARQRVLAALEARRGGAAAALAPAPRGRRVVHVVHGWPPFSPGGVESYARWLATHQAAQAEVAVYARHSDPERRHGYAFEHLDGGVRVRLVVNDFTRRDPLARNALLDRRLAADFRRFLVEERPELVHIHHLSGHALGLAAVARRVGAAVLWQAQDWWPACARVNFWHREGFLCTGPGLHKCSRCLPLTRLPGATAWNPLLYALRGRLARRQLRRADGIVFGSQAIAASYRLLGLLGAGDRHWVLPYGVPLADDDGHTAGRAKGGAAARPLRCGFVGSLYPHKGGQVAVAAFREVPAEEAVLELWGDPGELPPELQGSFRRALPASVRVRGRFPPGGEPAVYDGMDLLLVPSLGLESFGLAAREAWARGVPVLASRRGALADLLVPGRGGDYLERPEDPGELARRVRELAARPEVLAGWRAAIPPVKGFADHAEEVEAVYAELLGSRP
jgi:glycosyltransferase involved in cell wall biosynthesis/GT2 family glycosyltransferase